MLCFLSMERSGSKYLYHHLSCYANNIWRQTIYIKDINCRSVILRLSRKEQLKQQIQTLLKRTYAYKLWYNVYVFFHWFIGFFLLRNLMILYTRTHKMAKFIPDFILDRFVLVNYYGWSKHRQLHYKMILLHHPNPVLKPCQLRS